MSKRMSALATFAVALFSVAGGTAAMAQGHSYINLTRGSYGNNVYLVSGVEGVYGSYERGGAGVLGSKPTVDDGEAVEGTAGGEPVKANAPEAVAWQGIGIRSGAGFEMKKFLRLGVSHTYVSLNGRGKDVEHLEGSRLALDGRFVFSGPLFDLELGGGATAGRYDFQQNLNRAGVYGSGYYYSLGMSHFLSHRVSFYCEGKVLSERLSRDDAGVMRTALFGSLMTASAGTSIWL